MHRFGFNVDAECVAVHIAQTKYACECVRRMRSYFHFVSAHFLFTRFAAAHSTEGVQFAYKLICCVVAAVAPTGVDLKLRFSFSMN